MGLHEGQVRAQVSPPRRAPQSEPGVPGGPLASRGARCVGAEAAAALAYTAVVRLGGPKAYPSVDRAGMGVYYDATQLADTVKAMREHRMSKVSLPNALIEDNDVPPHLHTYLQQLPAQFAFDDVTIIRKKMVLEVYDLQQPTIIPPGPAGSLRAYTVTNGEVTSSGDHGPPFTRTMTHMCPADLATPLLTPGEGGATLLVTTCPISPVPGGPRGQAGTAVHVVSKQKAGDRLAIVDFQVDEQSRCVTTTPVGGEPWVIDYHMIARIKDDGNGKLSLTFKAGDMPTLARRPWTGWPLAWTEWLRQTHSGNPTVMFHAPPGQESDTALAGSMYGALAASGAGPIPVNLALLDPIDQRLLPVPAQTTGRAGGGPTPAAGTALAPAGTPRARSTSRTQGTRPKPKPKTSTARTPTNTPPKTGGKKQTTLTTIARKDKK